MHERTHLENLKRQISEEVRVAVADYYSGLRTLRDRCTEIVDGIERAGSIDAGVNGSVYNAKHVRALAETVGDVRAAAVRYTLLVDTTYAADAEEEELDTTSEQLAR